MPTAATSISFQKSLWRSLSTLPGGSLRSKKGCSSFITSLGRRPIAARAPSRSGLRLKAANSTANGGQYSTQRRERKLIIIKAVEKKRKKSGRAARFLSDES